MLMNSPGDMVLTLLHEAAAAGAVCLDGSPSGYYYREGADPSKFLIVLNGGGWCYGADENASKYACAERAETSLGTSSLWKATLHEDAHGMTSSNCTINPAFCTWSIAYIYYCDGHSFSGDLEHAVAVPGGKVSPIYLRGRRVLHANIQDLLQRRGLADAKTVVLSGHSAGGLATFLHADYVAALLPKSVVSFSAAPDAGFFLDHPDVYGRPTFGRAMRASFRLANASSALYAQCKRSHADPFDCVFPQHFAQYIQTPLHVIQSQYDSWQLSNILRLTCDPPRGTCNASMLATFQRYHETEKHALNASGLYGPSRGQRSAWNDACIAHSQAYYGQYMDNEAWKVPALTGVTLATSLLQWVQGKGAVRVDRVTWPGNVACNQFTNIDAQRALVSW